MNLNVGLDLVIKELTMKCKYNLIDDLCIEIRT